LKNVIRRQNLKCGRIIGAEDVGGSEGIFAGLVSAEFVLEKWRLQE
jgi:hypothetical protein